MVHSVDAEKQRVGEEKGREGGMKTGGRGKMQGKMEKKSGGGGEGGEAAAAHSMSMAVWSFFIRPLLRSRI